MNKIFHADAASGTRMTALALVIAFTFASGSIAQAPSPGSAPGAPPSGPGPVQGLPPGPSAGTVLLPKPPGPNAPKPTRNARDFEGVYVGSPGNAATLFGNMNAAFTARGQARVSRRLALMMNNLAPQMPGQLCRPYGNIFNVAQPVFPVTILQTNKRLVILSEEGRGVWEIFLDRGHPANPKPTYNGHSIGRWEGDTLVVDIVGFNGKQWLDQLTGPNSPQSHATLRIRKLVERGALEFDVSIKDPEVFVDALKATYGLEWNPDMRMHEFDCESSFGVGSFPGIVIDTDESPAKLPASAVMPPPGATGMPPPPGFGPPPAGASAPMPPGAAMLPALPTL